MAEVERRSAAPRGLPAEPPDRLRQLPSWLLIRLYGPANRLVASSMGDPGARADYAVLTTLSECGAQSQADLCRRLAVDRSDMVAIIDHLTESKWVLRAPDRADRRRNTITMTRSGRRRLAELDERVDTAQDQLLAPLSPARRSALLATLQELVEHHRAAGS